MPDNKPNAEVRLDRVTKKFGEFTAVDNATVTIPAGEFVTLLGPSGSGKTTTLNMIAGFETPTSGDITLDGRSLNDVPVSKRKIGMVFQGYALFPHMTVGDNIAYPLKRRKCSKEKTKERVAEVLDLVGLSSFSNRMPAQLSGGQRQRVALARAVAYEPPVLLMDEPLSALDKALREHLQQEIKAIHRNLGTTVVYVTHDQDEALALSDQVVVFNDGAIQQVGSPQDLYANPANSFVAGFLGESLRLKTDGSDGRLYLQGAELPYACPPDAGAAELMVRPEQISATAGRPPAAATSGSGRTSVEAVVQDATYIGHAVRYKVDVPGAGGGVVRQPVGAGPSFHPGETVTLSWATDDGRILLP